MSVFSISVGSKESVWLTIAPPGTEVLLHPLLDYPSFKSKLGFGIGQGPTRKVETTLSISYRENFMQGIGWVVIEEPRHQERMLN